MNKKIRYVHGVNPITGIQCTNRIVVTQEDVTLWQVDKVLDTEAEFDRVDSGEVGMVCLTHTDFKKVMKEYAELYGMYGVVLDRGIIVLEEEGEG